MELVASEVENNEMFQKVLVPRMRKIIPKKFHGHTRGASRQFWWIQLEVEGGCWVEVGLDRHLLSLLSISCDHVTPVGPYRCHGQQ